MNSRHTAQLILRDYTETDLDPLFEILGDVDHMKLTYPAQSRSDCAEWLNGDATLRGQFGFAPWTLVHRQKKVVVGWGGLGLDTSAPEWGPEVTYFIHPSYQGKGFATEVTRAAVELAFVEHALAKVSAFARPENLASTRVLEKCDFELITYEAGLERNRYEISKDRWERQHR